MPEIIYKADQGAGVRKIIRIMQGDTRSHVVRFVVPRYESGVDLSSLAWCIKLVDPNGVSDVALPSALYEVTADEIRVRWTVNGVSTDVVGSTKFQLYGVGKDSDGNKIGWTSGAGEIEVTENIGFEVTDEQDKDLTALDELIVFVQGSLNDVIAAGNSAAAAATTANAAAERAEAAADGAVDATAAAIRANAAAEAAENAAANANNVLDVKANALTASATGNPVQIHPDEGSVLKPVLTFEPVQAGSGDPSPDNIRPITGRTGAELVRCGKNLCPGFESGGYATANGAPFDSTNYQRTKKIPITAGAVYAHSTSRGWNPNDIHFWDKDGNWLGVYTDVAKINNRPTGAAYMAFNYLQHELTWVQLELGSTVTPFEPYQGDTFALNFGQTIYGGTLDWNKGEMVDNKTYQAFTGTESFSVYDKYYVYYASDSLNVANAPIVSSHFKTLDSWYAADNDGLQGVNMSWGIRFYVRDMFATVDDFKAYLAAQYAAGTPVQIAYKLATPITIQLTPQQIVALEGLNTVYSDADGMVVNYNRDLANAYEELRNAIIAMGGNV